ncbi:hypothetical protein BRARA_D00354 [Brassica rapa]|uniref:Uncharacterized protein n=1 Tax=Brassica campestris TaxID=3711 RepID=A0A397ZLA9_BRACM|nr:hypothetical protein BRARA_D00354 [Brassica rapa]
MEAHRSVSGKLQRKPMGDCANTVSRTSQQTSAFSTNPSLISSLKRLASSRSTSTCVRPVARRISADLGFPAPTSKLVLW